MNSDHLNAEQLAERLCSESHFWVDGVRTHIDENGEDVACNVPTAEESYRTAEPCGHTSNFQIGDERGNFTCAVCRMKAAEKASRINAEEMRDLRESLAVAQADRDRLRSACIKSNDEIQQVLGKALGFMWYKDDQEAFPSATHENGVFTGEHTAESMADVAAERITFLEKRLREMPEEFAQIAEGEREICGAFPAHAFGYGMACRDIAYAIRKAGAK